MTLNSSETHLSARTDRRSSSPFLAKLTLAAGPGLALVSAAPAFGAQEVASLLERGDEPLIAQALAAVSEDVRVYNDHLTILASPWMEGRLPGTPGMERAMEYMEFHFEQYGLRAPFPKEVETADGTLAVQPGGSFRQPFRLRAVTEVTSAKLEHSLGGAGVEFHHGVEQDFTVTSMGAGGDVSAPAVFVGYSIEGGPGGFTSFPKDLDLNGRVAVMLRFEPMGANGFSKWRDGAESWTRSASFSGKLRAAADRGAAGIVIINPPGTGDPRAKRLRTPGGSASSQLSVPVLHMSTEAGRALVASAFGGGETTLEGLVEHANGGAHAMELPGTLSINANLDKVQTRAENVVAVLAGKGRLADQYIVIGAHLDHLGEGAFGSLDVMNAGRKLHPGADDNASGSAGILLIAEKMARAYGAMDGDLRSVVFIGFSAEESGLHGSDFYVRNPVAPIEDHTLMMNFDMIGRIQDKRLSLSGLETGYGLADLVEPIMGRSPLRVIPKGSPRGSSDHTRFEDKEIPVLFAILHKLHGDRHTPRDVSSLINRVDAVHAANLFYEIGMAVASRSEPVAFQPRAQRPAESGADVETGGAARAQAPARVQLGVRLDRSANLEVTQVVPGSTAEVAGVLVGDQIIGWNGQPITDLVAILAAAKVGDHAAITVLREGKRVELAKARLQARRLGGQAPAPGPGSGANPRSASSTPKVREPVAEAPAPAGSPRAGSKVMFGIRPVYTDKSGGVVADSVTKGSPADEAGLEAGDRVLTWNGEEIDGARALGELLKGAKAGDVIEVVVERKGKEITKKVTLRARGDGS